MFSVAEIDLLTPPESGQGENCGRMGLPQCQSLVTGLIMMDGNPKALLNSSETAKALGVDRKTLRKWVRDGVCPVAPLPSIEPPVWRRADVELFVGCE